MAYKITPYSYQAAKRLNVNIYPSKRQGKKIDVYKNGRYIASIGAAGYMDFPNIVKRYGTQEGLRRRKLYRIRHAANINNPGTAGYYAARILW